MMNKGYRYLIGIWFFLVAGCEEVIDVNLKDATPQLVIVGEVSNRMEDQDVIISRTVTFDQEQPFDPVSGAIVTIHDGRGTLLELTERAPGRYSRRFKGEIGQTYQLRVRVEGQEFTATSRMPEPVLIDSIGTGVRNIFGEEQKFISVKYGDPVGVANYYRYLWRVNNGPRKAIRITNDKFNDGKYVNEDVTDFDTELVTGDSVTLWMLCVDKTTYDFWNVVQANNPGTAAPANPPSVFGPGALGYFSAQTVAEYSVGIQ